RLLTSAANSGDAFGLRCEIREGILDFLQANHPESLPVMRMRPEPAEPRDDDRKVGQSNEVARSRHEAGWQPAMEKDTHGGATVPAGLAASPRCRLQPPVANP